MSLWNSCLVQVQLSWNLKNERRPLSLIRMYRTHKLCREILKQGGLLTGCFVWLFSLQEYEIDKTLGIKGPEDVAKMGIEAYNKECRGIVMRYSKEWEVSEGSGHVLLSISTCVCAQVFQVGWTSSFCLIMCINLCLEAPVILKGEQK